MKKITVLRTTLQNHAEFLTASQMSSIKGGTSTHSCHSLDFDNGLIENNIVSNLLSVALDDKRRDRPGGGVSTH